MKIIKWLRKRALKSRILAYRIETGRLCVAIEDYFGRPRTFVRVDAPSYKGIGVFVEVAQRGYIDVMLANGNTWSYPAECCEPVTASEVPRSLRIEHLRRMGVACNGIIRFAKPNLP